MAPSPGCLPCEYTAYLPPQQPQATSAFLHAVHSPPLLICMILAAPCTKNNLIFADAYDCVHGTQAHTAQVHAAGNFCEIVVFGTMEFALEQHKQYVHKLDSNQTSFEYVVTEHLRLSGVYWAMSALEVWGAGDEYDKKAVADWVMQCYNETDGSFGGNVGHDGHMLYTLSGVQLLALCGELGRIDGGKTASFVAALQQPDGSFAGDEWGEIDTRFSYCALCCCSILDTVDVLDVPAAVRFVLACQNFDGGFGACPGAESHGGQVFTCVAVLAMANALDKVDADRLGWWLCERQCDSGGLNGRPEKQSDVCYSWWNLTALQVLGRLHWINTEKLTQFILECQDTEDGGIADRPGNVADVYHTFFGSAGLSLLGSLDSMGVPHCPIDPVYALPKPLVERLGLTSQQLSTKRLGLTSQQLSTKRLGLTSQQLSTAALASPGAAAAE